MKIVFEHQGRKTIIIGNDYESIMNKIRLLFPGENDTTVLFYDNELDDFFDFTSFDQIQDQPNGVKMTFNSFKRSNDVGTDACSPSAFKNNESEKSNDSQVKKFHPGINRKKKKQRT